MNKKHAAIMLGLSILTTQCITTHDRGPFNVSEYGSVYTSVPTSQPYSENRYIDAQESSFFWTDCEEICRDALDKLVRSSNNLNGDGIIDLNFYSTGDAPSKVPTCQTNWSWVFLYYLPVLGPWVQECEVQGLVVNFEPENDNSKYAATATHNSYKHDRIHYDSGSKSGYISVKGDGHKTRDTVVAKISSICSEKNKVNIAGKQKKMGGRFKSLNESLKENIYRIDFRCVY